LYPGKLHFETSSHKSCFGVVGPSFFPAQSQTAKRKIYRLQHTTSCISCILLVRCPSHQVVALVFLYRASTSRGGCVLIVGLTKGFVSRYACFAVDWFSLDWIYTLDWCMKPTQLFIDHPSSRSFCFSSFFQ